MENRFSTILGGKIKTWFIKSKKELRKYYKTAIK